MVKGGATTYEIIGVAPEAFATSKRTKTLKISWDYSLEKEMLRDCLKGSNITKVIISYGNVDDYMKWFSDASLVGKSVKVEVE